MCTVCIWCREHAKFSCAVCTFLFIHSWLLKCCTVNGTSVCCSQGMAPVTFRARMPGTTRLHPSQSAVSLHCYRGWMDVTSINVPHWCAYTKKNPQKNVSRQPAVCQPLPWCSRRNSFQFVSLIMMIIIRRRKVFLKHKIVSVETVISAYTHRQRHPHAQAFWPYKAKIYTAQNGQQMPGRPGVDEDISMEQETWQV